MYELHIPSRELWDEKNEKIIQTCEMNFLLEHSLIAISKWEKKFKKPFMSDYKKSNYEWKYYITKCMVIGKSIPDIAYDSLSMNEINEILNYIKDPMTATTINEKNKKSISSEETTSELIYAWMTILRIPFEPTEKWHLNRLLTLIRVVDIKSKPQKKKSTREILSENARLNAERRKKYNSKG